MKSAVVSILLCASPVLAISAGSYSVSKKSYTYSSLDKTSRTIHVWYPKGSSGQKFPFIEYAHGRSCGGSALVGVYNTLLTDMASYGYVIASHESCSTGCSDGARDPSDPKGFANFYKQQLMVIDWAKSQTDSVFKTVDFSLGVGVSGHSMGGQSTVYSASSKGSGHGIKAAVSHHAYTHTYSAPVVPHLLFTGTTDSTAPPSMSTNVFNAKNAYPSRGIVNKVGAGHMEVNSGGNIGNLAKFTVAWFKIYLDGTPQADGNDYNELIYGKGSSSLCHGGDGSMQTCKVLGGSTEVVV